MTPILESSELDPNEFKQKIDRLLFRDSTTTLAANREWRKSTTEKREHLSTQEIDMRPTITNVTFLKDSKSTNRNS
jgi:hypothetical protein